MAASPEVDRKLVARRRSRYIRDAASAPALTPPRWRLLQAVADYGLISRPQLARLCGPSEKSVQRGARALFDGGLVDIVAVPRAALAEPGQANDASLLFGSAPNIYVPTRAGLRLLHEHGLIEAPRPVPAYGPRNGLFLRHELALRDVRLWLDLTARPDVGQALEVWRDGVEALIDLGRAAPPRAVRPDAWFVYRLPGPKGGRSAVLAGAVELDRGTERGASRWGEKVAAYEALFAGRHWAVTTGYVNGRVLIVCPDERRHVWLARFLREHAPSEMWPRFWLTTRSMLTRPDLGAAAWRQPGSDLLRPLVPAELLAPVEVSGRSPGNSAG